MILNDWIMKDESGEMMTRVLKTFLDCPKSYGRSVVTSLVEARLLSVSNNALMGTMPVVRIEYETSQGEKVVDDRTGSAIYDMCVTFYRLRGRISLKPVRDTHWA